MTTSSPGGGDVPTQSSIERRERFESFYDKTSVASFSLALHLIGESTAAEQACEAAYVDVMHIAPGVELSRDKLLCRVRFHALQARTTIRGAGSTATAPPSYKEVAGLRAALTTLDQKGRRALELACFGGLNVSEIAELMATPAAVVRAAMRDALLQLAD